MINHAALAAHGRLNHIRQELEDVGEELRGYQVRLVMAETEISLLALLEQVQYASGRYDGLKYALDRFEDF